MGVLYCRRYDAGDGSAPVAMLCFVLVGFSCGIPVAISHTAVSLKHAVRLRIVCNNSYSFISWRLSFIVGLATRYCFGSSRYASHLVTKIPLGLLLVIFPSQTQLPPGPFKTVPFRSLEGPVLLRVRGLHCRIGGH
ncbi:hypothetical protein CC86DRAFT_173233 [Ophiobolus disseminans]|uniref:Uncharacterized protein n=1 Tax=Ophiobolus disseminans TaxID=1469910 RepID=A0A6A7A8R5_9PLEO|nr:hypothetical protein CC86DRAFT_173233 [Ophiobolus disseminans]